MTYNNFNTLSEAVDAWTQKGFNEDFDTIQGKIRSLHTKETYEPEATSFWQSTLDMEVFF